VVGEFGIENNGQPVDEMSVMAQAQQRGIGYIGWSWSGNGSGGVVLDIVSNFSTTLSNWGNILVNDSNGIANTAVPATVFGTTGSSLSVSPTTISLGSAASNALVSVSANVMWTAADNATWLTVSPAAGTNNGSITVSAIANTATTSRSGVVTVTGGNLSRTISVTQNGMSSGGNDGVTVSRAVTSSSGWFNEEQVILANTAPMTALSVTIVVQRTTGVSYSGMWNNVGGQVAQSNSSTAAAITYQFTLAAGQTLSAATNRQFVAQAGGTGTVHPTTGDTYTVTYTTGGVQHTQSGTF
jgi:mannan endo-1,4-beta-mannosidase